MPHSINLADLGRRVRSMRIARGLTLEEVVRRADFTVSWLSKLENGLLTPSLDGLVKLSEVLECGVDELVEGLSARPRHVVVRKGRGRIDAGRERGSDMRLEHLADAWRGRGMHPVVMHIGSNGGRPTTTSHEGERFFLVLDGEINLEYGGDRIHLSEGDSVYIDAKIPHTIATPGRTKARVLCVSFDPSQSRSRRKTGTPKAATSKGVPSRLVPSTNGHRPARSRS